MKNKIQNEIQITARAKAFSGQGVRQHLFLVTNDDVKVYDPIAQHFTSCHAMGYEVKSRIARLSLDAYAAH